MGLPKLPMADRCCGCLACVDACGSGAIEASVDAEGFPAPVLNAEACKECGRCEAVCPIIAKPRLPDTIEVQAWAAWSLRDEIRAASSSGGVFTHLAETILSENGVVFGAAMESDFKVRHRSVEVKEELADLRGSKYVPSDPSGMYRRVQKMLFSGRKVLFTGTPCQVAGLYGFLGTRRFPGQLVTCDVICHGVPSPLVFEAYRNEMGRRHGSEVKEIQFRDKSDGWTNFAMRVELKNGQTIRRVFRNDEFMQVFLKDHVLRPICYQCPFSRIPRSADLTLGDFWGLRSWPEQHAKGVSLVLVNSGLGAALWNRCKGVERYPVSLREAARANPRIYTGKNVVSGFRHKAIQDLNTLSFNEFAAKYSNRDTSWKMWIAKKQQNFTNCFALMKALGRAKS